MSPRTATGERDRLAGQLFEAALAGGRALMPLWRSAVRIARKGDGSLVSEADHAADEAVRQAIAAAGLAWPLVSEETVQPSVSAPERFLLLDPLDGTSDFLDHGAEFCVCLAAIERGRPVAGAIVAPALGEAWHGGESAFAIALTENLEPGAPRIICGGGPGEEQLTGLVSRRHGDARSDADLERCGARRRIGLSSAVKYGRLAEGRADIHIRHGRTMGWDIAAGDAILAAAGGAIRGMDGRPLDYSGAGGDFSNPPFVAVSRLSLLDGVLAAVQRAS